MNREIKFRAWDGEKMWNANHIVVGDGVFTYGGHNIPDNHYHYSKVDWTPMQYTGLLDKSGKEIYEGDILRLDKDWQGRSSNGVKVGAVEYKECCFCLELYDSLPLYLLVPAVVEVIGNIYENPEFIKN